MLILLYHRIGDARSDVWGLSVSEANFASHMATLREIAAPVRLADMIEEGKAVAPAANAVAVTFDDGYADNFTLARPILEKHGVPATVFVCVGAVGRKHEFWWDELERILLSPETPPPPVLELEAGGERRGWRISGGAAKMTPETMFVEVWSMLRLLPEAERIAALDRIKAWARHEAAPRPGYRALTLEELRELADCPIIDIGAHTMSHPLLRGRERAFQESEVAGSKRWLEDALGRAVESFSYPYGECDETSLEAVRRAGFQGACVCGNRAVTPGASAYELPRVSVGNWDKARFIQAVLGRMPRRLQPGERTTLPLAAFRTQTGETGGAGIECRPGRDRPGYCLYGLETRLADAGSYRFEMTFEQEPPCGDDAVLDAYETNRTKSVLAETLMHSDGEAYAEMRLAALEFSAEAEDTVEFRLFWRGGGRFRVVGAALTRLARA